MLTHTQLQFFVLLRAGLWDKPVDVNELQNPEAYQETGSEKNPEAYQRTGSEKNPEAYQEIGSEKNTGSGKDTGSAPNTDVDWPAIYRIAREQTVIGLIADAIGTLPKEQRPPMPILQKFIMDKLAIERSHVKLNAVLNEVVEALNAHNIPHVLLKGQGVAQNYPHPTSRTCGDIDLYVGQENYHKAIEILKPYSDHPETKTEETIKHASLEINGVDIELHKMTAVLDPRKANENFQAATIIEINENWKEKAQGTLEHWNNKGANITLPAPEYNANFLLIHLSHHLIYGGIGLRQLCDWTRFLHTHLNDLDKNSIKEEIEKFGLTKVWNTYSSFIHIYLGMPLEEIPFDVQLDESAAQKIATLIYTTGNFGHHDAAGHKAQDTRYIVNKWKRFTYHLSYYAKVFPLFPKLVLLAQIRWFNDGMKAFFKGLKK